MVIEKNEFYMLMVIEQFDFKIPSGTKLPIPVDISVKTPPGVVGFQYVFDSLESLRAYEPNGNYVVLKRLERENEE